MPRTIQQGQLQLAAGRQSAQKRQRLRSCCEIAVVKLHPPHAAMSEQQQDLLKNC
jgi:hypothetical protein